MLQAVPTAATQWEHWQLILATWAHIGRRACFNDCTILLPDYHQVLHTACVTVTNELLCFLVLCCCPAGPLLA